MRPPAATWALVALAIGCRSADAPGQKALAFILQPTGTTAQTTMSPVSVQVKAAGGVADVSAADSISLTIGGNAGAGALTGTTRVKAINGVATFTGLAITAPGRKYNLVAIAPGDSSASSAPFDIVIPLAILTGAGNVACAATATGTAYCWGQGISLGNGSTMDSNVPVSVSGGLRFKALSGGGGHVCGLTTAGAIYCWGHNATGQLGNGTTTRSDVPVPVSGGHLFAALATGGTVGSHSCAIATDSTAYCWGANHGGQLGIGTAVDSSDVPAAVSGGLKFRTLTAGGGSHTCGLTGDSVAYCWGFNDDGRIGNGTAPLSNVPVPVTGGLRFAMITAGGAHTCALSSTGTAYCWGNNSNGQLGHGAGPNDSVPTPVSGSLTFTTLAASIFGTCGINNMGAVYCWGGSSPLTSGTPAPLNSQLSFSALGAGQFHACGIAASGAAYCWGNNAVGQLGDGTNTNNQVPVLVLSIP